MALLLNQVGANSAIVTSTTVDGVHDVSLNITQLALLPGLSSWDDLSFNSLQEPWFSKYDGDMALDLWEMLAVLDVASGTLCKDTEGCMDDIASHYQSFLADQVSHEPLEKRFR